MTRLSEAETKWLLATSLQFHDTAGVIAKRAGDRNGRRFAGWARRNRKLFQLQYSYAGYHYRLSETGRALAEQLACDEAWEAPEA
jgi:hypothetical protein